MKLKVMTVLAAMLVGSVQAEIKVDRKGKVKPGDLVLTEETRAGGNCPLKIDNNIAEVLKAYKKAKSRDKKAIKAYIKSGEAQDNKSAHYKKAKKLLDQVNYQKFKDQACLEVVSADGSDVPGVGTRITPAQVLDAKIKLID